MKILVTGASGFLGRHIVERLLLDNHQVIATSTSLQKASSLPWFDRVEYLQHDLHQPVENFFEYFHQPDHLIHLAWEGLPEYDSEIHVTQNLPVHARFIINMATHGLTGCSVLGTCLEYGLQEGELHENMQTAPINNYGKAKDSLRQILEKNMADLDCRLNWLRLFYTYGAGQSKRSLLSQLEQAIENEQESFDMSRGDQVRDYLPVEQVSDLIVRVALQPKHQGTVNICSGKPQTVKTLVERYLSAQGIDMKLNLGVYDYPAYEPMAFWGSTSKLHKLIGTEK